MKTLITGGAGYIGSHVAAALLQEGHSVVLVDNLSCSDTRNVEALRSMFDSSVSFYQLDVTEDLSFAFHGVDSVVHCAGLKSVSESELHPLRYYQQNVGGLLSVLTAMQEHGVRDIVFSSSATVYGGGDHAFSEDSPTNPNSVYGQTKADCERILLSSRKSGIVPKILRYFNPIGAHHSGKLGEYPMYPTNLLPVLIDCARSGKPLSVFGNDYDTEDGTAIRDYIHVEDVADAHVLSLLYETDITVNIGTGVGYSVLELVFAFNMVSPLKVTTNFHPRRAGDVERLVCDPTLARTRLGFRARRLLVDACRSALLSQGLL